MKSLTAIGAIAALALIGSWLFVRASHAKRFSEVAWKSSETDKFGLKVGNARRWMVKDLTSRVLKIGMPRENVFSLLGPPDSEAWDTNTYWQQYYIGQDFGVLRLFPTIIYLDLYFENEDLKTYKVEAVK